MAQPGMVKGFQTTKMADTIVTGLKSTKMADTIHGVSNLPSWQTLVSSYRVSKQPRLQTAWQSRGFKSANSRTVLNLPRWLTAVLQIYLLQINQKADNNKLSRVSNFQDGRHYSTHVFLLCSQSSCSIPHRGFVAAYPKRNKKN